MYMIFPGKNVNTYTSKYIHIIRSDVLSTVNCLYYSFHGNITLVSSTELAVDITFCPRLLNVR